MKDPLQKASTPYEILSVPMSAAASDVDRAFGDGLVKRQNVQKLTAARQALTDPVERLLVDWYHYDPETLGRLTPNPLVDATALEPPERWETGRTWEVALKARFPDLGIVRSLAVLWYWGALHQEAFRSEGRGAEPSPRSLWERAIACWAVLITDPLDTFDVAPELREPFKKKLVEGLRHQLQDLEQSAREHGDEQSAKVYEELELMLDTELTTAGELASIGLRSGEGPIACGPLMLEQMGALEAVRSQVTLALRNAPRNPALEKLRAALSPNRGIAELIRKQDPTAALAALDALAAEEQETSEIRELRGDAYAALAQQQASLDHSDEALASWGKALELSPSLEPRIGSDLESYCHKRAAALQARQADEAIALLESATALVSSPKLRLTLAEILSQRGVETINKAQKKAGDEGGTASPELLAVFQRGLDDLERASNLGSESAGSQAGQARMLMERGRWLARKARVVDFNQLPETARRRFVSAIRLGGSPSPLLEDRVTGAAGWIGMAVVGLVLTLLTAWVGFGSLEQGLYQGQGVMYWYVLCLFFTALGVSGTYRVKLLAKRYPYPLGRYIFPMEYVDARDRRVKIVPMREVYNFQGVHQHTNGIYSGTEFSFRFMDEELKTVTAKFRMRGKPEAEGILQHMQSARRFENEALMAGNFQALRDSEIFGEAP